MIFLKYEALGNDFIITKDQSISNEDALKLCNRNFGIGADGILIHTETLLADAEMKIINSDGSIPEMCGNGLRCFVSYLVTECGFKRSPLRILTGIGVLEAEWNETNGGIEVSANLGKAEMLGHETIEIDDERFDLYGISMGNPHIVVFSENKVDFCRAKKIAVKLQNDNFLKVPVNLEVVTEISLPDKKASLIVNERGAGFTLGCGTGGAAVVNALILKTGNTGNFWKISFPGGTVDYTVLENGNTVMTGIPNKVFKGEMCYG
jgi:diaminopimelate epimerase